LLEVTSGPIYYKLLLKGRLILKVDQVFSVILQVFMVGESTVPLDVCHSA